MSRTLLLPCLLSLLWSPLLQAAPVAKPVEWKIGGDTFAGVLVYDDAAKQPRPGLVMVPNWKGVNESAIEKARLVVDTLFPIMIEALIEHIRLQCVERSGKGPNVSPSTVEPRFALHRVVFDFDVRRWRKFP